MTPKIGDVRLCILPIMKMEVFDSFAVLDLKLWLEGDGNLHTDLPFISIQIHSMEVLKLIESVAIF